MRQIFLDTETTGLDPKAGHRVIEIACLEMQDHRLTGRRLHFYLNPERKIEADAKAVHGIDDKFLQDKPKFAQIAAELREFISGAELVIHNAPFDIGFLDAEFARLDLPATEKLCASVLDTLKLARELHPGRANSLDALCERYRVNNTRRESHGALLDAELLAEVYLAMTRSPLLTPVFAGHNKPEGILVCGYEQGGETANVQEEVARWLSLWERPAEKGAFEQEIGKEGPHDIDVFSRKVWGFEKKIIEWFRRWGHSLEGKENELFAQTIAQINWCTTRNSSMRNPKTGKSLSWQETLKKLLDPVQVENFLHHVRTLQPRLILFFGAQLINALNDEKVLERFQDLVGKGKPAKPMQKEFKGKTKDNKYVWFQNFKRRDGKECDVVCLPHATGRMPPDDDYIALFKDEISPLIQEVKNLKGI